MEGPVSDTPCYLEEDHAQTILNQKLAAASAATLNGS